MNNTVDFTICNTICKSRIRGKKYCIAPGAGNKRDVLTHEIVPHSGEFASVEGRPGVMPHYSPGIWVRGFPLTTA